MHLVVIARRVCEPVRDHRRNQRIRFECRNCPLLPDGKALDNRIRARSEGAVEDVHPLHKPKCTDEVVAVPQQEVLHAQMCHTRVKEQLSLRRHEGEDPAPRDKHGICAVRRTQFFE